MTIEPDKMFAFVGPSGGGKTTLLKIMMGLLAPTFGDVLVDGVPLPTYGLSRWRKEIASVTQDGSLFAGSLADNISLFDPALDQERLLDATQSAHIAAEIEAFPMQYDTPVGDMGSSLSGGQKQRVMLARALYRKPRALFLDEATAHLDPRNEELFLRTVNQVRATRIVTAHRPQAMRHADRIFLVADGQVMMIKKTPSDGAPHFVAK